MFGVNCFDRSLGYSMALFIARTQPLPTGFTVSTPLPATFLKYSGVLWYNQAYLHNYNSAPSRVNGPCHPIVVFGPRESAGGLSHSAPRAGLRLQVEDPLLHSPILVDKIGGVAFGSRPKACYRLRRCGKPGLRARLHPSTKSTLRPSLALLETNLQ